jgi:hypothetical protein
MPGNWHVRFGKRRNETGRCEPTRRGAPTSPYSLFPSRDHRGLDGDRQAGDDRRCIRLRTEAQRRMPGGRLSCLARNGGAAARGRKSNDGIAAGDRGVADLRPDQAINETAWCVLFGTEKSKEDRRLSPP